MFKSTILRVILRIVEIAKSYSTNPPISAPDTGLHPSLCLLLHPFLPQYFSSSTTLGRLFPPWRPTIMTSAVFFHHQKIKQCRGRRYQREYWAQDRGHYFHIPCCIIHKTNNTGRRKKFPAKTLTLFMVKQERMNLCVPQSFSSIFFICHE